MNEAFGPVQGLSQQLLAVLTTVQSSIRLRYELFGRFPSDFTQLHDQERRARIQGIPRILESVTTESDARGNVTLQDLQSAFDEDEADRIGQLLAYWPDLKNDLYDALGVSHDGNLVSDQGLVGPNLDKYRLAFDALRLINVEILARSSARLSRLFARPDEELMKSAKLVEGNVRTLKQMRRRVREA